MVEGLECFGIPVQWEVTENERGWSVNARVQQRDYWWQDGDGYNVCKADIDDVMTVLIWINGGNAFSMTVRAIS